MLSSARTYYSTIRILCERVAEGVELQEAAREFMSDPAEPFEARKRMQSALAHLETLLDDEAIIQRLGDFSNRSAEISTLIGEIHEAGDTEARKPLGGRGVTTCSEILQEAKRLHSDAAAAIKAA